MPDVFPILDSAISPADRAKTLDLYWSWRSRAIPALEAWNNAKSGLRPKDPHQEFRQLVARVAGNFREALTPGLLRAGRAIRETAAGILARYLAALPQPSQSPPADQTDQHPSTR
ncbi:hypothetical protein [Zavarzinella formosa]|uniref:hypothetical protein n=1 Tax=Zavarzinella formosa TaxID=360055 RepID=UPI00031FEC03|nr:hypothetical protein [Zavarzinella formosa]